MNRKYFFVAGEDSGDSHASELIKEILANEPEAEILAVGGDKMQLAGAKIVEHIRDLNVVGIFEVLLHYRKIKKIFNNTFSAICDFKPDKVVLVDYPGFNLRLAKSLRQAVDSEIIYFILPQAWAWKANRSETIKNYTDKRLSIIPFEKNWFRQRGVDVEYIGHPFGYRFFNDKENIDGVRDGNKIVLMPGSRQVEVDRHLPIMINAATILSQKTGKEITLLKAPNVSVENFPQDFNIETDPLKHKEIIAGASLCLVASGTATLEVALLGSPMLVCYKMNPLTWFFATKLSTVKYISLVNLFLGRGVVKELLQKEMSTKSVVFHSEKLLQTNPSVFLKIQKDLMQTIQTNKNPFKIASEIIIGNNKNV